MTPSSLHRQLLFYGYDEVTDYLKNSPLNRNIYKLLLDLLPKHQLDVPMVKLFNEIYFQSIRVNYDGSPGMDINQRYINECSSWLNSRPAAEVVFATVWAILSGKRNINFHEECFLSQLTPYVKESEFFYYGEQLCDDLHKITIPDMFSTLTYPVDFLPELHLGERQTDSLVALIEEIQNQRVDYEAQMKELKEYSKAWQTVTCNYSHMVMEKLVRLYSSPADQLKLVERIEDSFPRDEIINQCEFIKDITRRIKTGRFGSEDTVTSWFNNIIEKTSEEDDEFRHKLAKHNAVDEEEKVNKEDKQTCQCDALPGNLAFPVAEMIEYVKDKFSLSSANEFITMCYRLFQRHGNVIDEETAQQLDNIEEAIRLREAKDQIYNFHTPHTININPQKVETKYLGDTSEPEA